MDVFSNVYILLCNGCVFPVGSFEAKRTFLVLSRIMSYIVNRMSVRRLTGLAMMLIHLDVIDFIT